MIVIKFGGHAMTDTSGSFAEVIRRTIEKENCVIVHGGGPQIDAALTAGTLTAAQAATMKANLKAHVTNEVNNVRPQHMDDDHGMGMAPKIPSSGTTASGAKSTSKPTIKKA